MNNIDRSNWVGVLRDQRDELQTRLDTANLHITQIRDARDTYQIHLRTCHGANLTDDCSQCRALLNAVFFQIRLASPT